jgi:hypothetical protein
MFACFHIQNMLQSEYAMFEAKMHLADWKMKCIKYKWTFGKCIRNTAAKKERQLGEQQAPFVDEAKNV